MAGRLNNVLKMNTFGNEYSSGLTVKRFRMTIFKYNNTETLIIKYLKKEQMTGIRIIFRICMKNLPKFAELHNIFIH